jgi:hypothetical protein
MSCSWGCRSIGAATAGADADVEGCDVDCDSGRSGFWLGFWAWVGLGRGEEGWVDSEARPTN